MSIDNASPFALSVIIGQAASCLILTGLALVVQLVVYPGLISFGRLAPAAWSALHEAHSRRIAVAVAAPWLVQGVTCAALPFVTLPGVPTWQVLLAGALGLLTVAATVGWAVPLHTRLSGRYDDRLAHRLLRANLVRLVAWAAASALALVMLLGA